MNADEIWEGMYVTHREYVAEPPYQGGGRYHRPAYLWPPIIGTVVSGPNPYTGTVIVQWPKGAKDATGKPGTLQCYPSELTVASHALIELEGDAARYEFGRQR